MLSKLGITSLLPSGTVTHLQGGALDQVFTNMITDSYSLSDSFLSDHKEIVANFKIDLTRQQTLQKQIKVVSQKSLSQGCLNP